MKISIKILVGFIILVLVGSSFGVVMGSQSGMESQSSMMVSYLLTSNNGEMLVVSNVTVFNSSWVYINMTEMMLTGVSAFNNSSYLLPLGVLQVSVHQGENTTFNIPGIPGNITTYSESDANRDGLVTYGYVMSVDPQASIYSFWSVSLLKESGYLYTLNNSKSAGKYYVFLPELLPPSSFSSFNGNSPVVSSSWNTLSKTTSFLQADPSTGEYAKLRLNEHDYIGLGLWYIFTNLSYLGSNTWSASGNAVAWSINWQVLEPYNLSVQGQPNGGLNASGYALFYGTFPWDGEEFWYAWPTVSITYFSSNNTFVGYVNDLILAKNLSGQIIIWKDGIWKNIFAGSVTVTDVITDRSSGPS